MEIWKTVPSLPAYQASSIGTIRHKPVWMKAPKGGFYLKEWKPTTGHWVEKDRRYMMGYRRKNYKVARMVCEAFNGLPPFEKAVCMHLNENSKDNRPENLAWGTQKQNLNAPAWLDYCSKAARARKLKDSEALKNIAREAWGVREEQ